MENRPLIGDKVISTTTIQVDYTQLFTILIPEQTRGMVLYHIEEDKDAVGIDFGIYGTHEVNFKYLKAHSYTS